MVTGNTVIDALHWAVRRARSLAPPIARVRERRILLTLHRRESQGKQSEEPASRCGPSPGAGTPRSCSHAPQSRRPRCRASRARRGRVHVCEPLGYLPLVRSGYVRPRAHRLGRAAGGGSSARQAGARPPRHHGATGGGRGRCSTPRRHGPEAIVDAASELLDDPFAYEAMAHPENPFGDGEARFRIVTALVDWHELRRAA